MDLTDTLWLCRLSGIEAVISMKQQAQSALSVANAILKEKGAILGEVPNWMVVGRHNEARVLGTVRK